MRLKPELFLREHSDQDVSRWMFRKIVWDFLLVRIIGPSRFSTASNGIGEYFWLLKQSLDYNPRRRVILSSSICQEFF